MPPAADHREGFISFGEFEALPIWHESGLERGRGIDIADKGGRDGGEMGL